MKLFISDSLNSISKILEQIRDKNFISENSTVAKFSTEAATDQKHIKNEKPL